MAPTGQAATWEGRLNVLDLGGEVGVVDASERDIICAGNQGYFTQPVSVQCAGFLPRARPHLSHSGMVSQSAGKFFRHSGYST